MRLHDLKPQPGAKHRRKRLGRGEGSGLGKTSGNRLLDGRMQASDRSRAIAEGPRGIPVSAGPRGTERLPGAAPR